MGMGYAIMNEYSYRVNEYAAEGNGCSDMIVLCGGVAALWGYGVELVLLAVQLVQLVEVMKRAGSGGSGADTGKYMGFWVAGGVGQCVLGVFWGSWWRMGKSDIKMILLRYADTKIHKNRCATHAQQKGQFAQQLRMSCASHILPPSAAVTLSSKNTLQYLFDLYSI